MSTDQPTMTPITLRELCAKATPGPWKVLRLGEFGWVDIRGGDGKALAFTGTRRELKATGMQPIDEANAQLIARCSPEVMLRVVEALERASNVGEIRFRTCALSAGASDSIAQALALLNGLTP